VKKFAPVQGEVLIWGKNSSKFALLNHERMPAFEDGGVGAGGMGVGVGMVVGAGVGIRVDCVGCGVGRASGLGTGAGPETSH